MLPLRLRPALLATALVFGAAAVPAAAQVCEGTVTLASQAEVDAFDCTSITGPLRIGTTYSAPPSDIQDLSPLSMLREVGALWITNNERLETLDGLQALTGTAGSVVIDSNPLLEHLDELAGIDEAYGIRIWGNDDLVRVSGLGGISHLPGSLDIQGNESLPNLAGLSLTRIEGHVSLLDNTAMSSLDGLDSLVSVDSWLHLYLLAIDDLEPLRALRHVGGYLALGNLYTLTDVTALSGVSGITGLGVTYNYALTSLDGLLVSPALVKVVQIEGNPVLRDVSSLREVEHIDGDLILFDNASLETLDGLASLRTMTGTLRVERNPSLQRIGGLTELTTVGGYLLVIDNPSLEALVGPPTLTELGGFYVRNNDALEALSGFNFVSDIAGSFGIWENESLTITDGFDRLATVGLGMGILGNEELRVLDGLGSLNSVGRDLRVSANWNLFDIRGLRALETVGESFYLQDAAGLQTLDALSSLRSVGGSLAVLANQSLAECGCGLSGLIGDGEFSGVADQVAILDNAYWGTCTSPSVVLANPCGATDDEAQPTPSLTIGVRPNPTASVARATYSLPTATDAHVAVYDALGREIAVLADGPHAAGEHQATLGTLAPGVYLVRVVTEAGTRTAALTVAR